MKLVAFELILLSAITICLERNENVCKTFEGYYTNADCYYNSDIYLEAPDMIIKYGYQVQIYNVTTEDGYILQVFRIPGNGPPVFLQHGIHLSCICFVDIGNNSLAFVLANAGYDVWLGNFRGNRYARKHISLNADSLKFWRFSVHELGAYDVKAQLKLVTQMTNSSVIYIGYSMGSTAGYIYSIINRELAKQQIKIMISLAPIAYLTNIPSIVRYLSPIWPGLEIFFNAFLHGEVLARNKAMAAMINQICLPHPHQMFACQIPYQMIFGPDVNQFDPLTLPITMSQNGDSSSTRTITHYKQIMDSNRFQHYDYGPIENMVRYRSVDPPIYNLNKITVPIYLIHSQNDYLSSENNVNRLYNELKPNVLGKYLVPYFRFNHADFVNGKDVYTLVYDHVIKLLGNFTA